MRIVNQGAVGPRAVSLQILLNRFEAGGTPLRVDGHYGPKTAQAVEAFRTEVLRTPGPGSSTDRALWDCLLGHDRLQVIEAADVTDSMLHELVVPEWTKNRLPPILIGGTSNGIERLMESIQLQSTSPRSVLALHFYSAAGTRTLARRIDFNLEMLVLNEITTGKLCPVLESIAPLFANFGFAEFSSCKLAHGGSGARLMQTLANLWNVPVSTPLGSPTGPARTFYPGRMTLQQWAESREQTAVLHSIVSESFGSLGYFYN